MTPGWEMVYSIRIPEPSILLNELIRMHWAQVRKYKLNLQQLVVEATMGQPRLSLPLCRIHVSRGNPKPFPDYDGVVGGLKPLLDVLAGFHPKVHPYGLDFIASDAPTCLQQIKTEPVETAKGQGYTRVDIYRPAAVARAA